MTDDDAPKPAATDGSGRRPAPISFAICDPATGRIKRVGTCAAEALALQALPGELAIETDGTVDDLSHYLKDGVLQPIPSEPGPDHVFDALTGLWRLDATAATTRLARLRAEALTEAAALIDARAEAITGTVPLVERLSWGAKEQAARAVIAGRASPEDAGMIAGEARVTGEDVALLATRILANADAWRLIAARMAALRRRAAAALALAEDEGAVARVFDDLAAALDQVTPSDGPNRAPEEASDAA